MHIWENSNNKVIQLESANSLSRCSRTLNLKSEPVSNRPDVLRERIPKEDRLD